MRRGVSGFPVGHAAPLHIEYRGIPMTSWHCPQCGTSFPEDTVCPGCLCETTPDTLHLHVEVMHAAMLRSDELTGSQRATFQLMRSNAGVRA